MEPTVERFRALTRSSPWRWSTLRYVQKRDQSGREDAPRRVFIRRPKLARVELLDGTLMRVHREPSRTVTPLSRRGDAPSIVLPTASDAEVDLDEDGLVRWRPGPFEMDADVHRVRIDVATGVCVFNEQIGGTRNGSGHAIDIEAVDEPMGDELFPQPPPSRWARIVGRR